MSRTLDILKAIKNGSTYTKPALSRSEIILKSIANKTTNLVDIADFQPDNLLYGVNITHLKGKVLSLAASIDNTNITGTGGRIRIDITNAGTTKNEFGNIVAGEQIGVSKIENLSIPSTATKVILYFQTFTESSDFVTFTNIMVNEGSISKPFTEYIVEPLSRYEELLLAIKNGIKTVLEPQTRLEEILVAIANDEAITIDGRSELEQAFIEAFMEM